MAPGTELAELAREAAACTRCPLAAGRTQVVFGVGDPDADLMFVGEAPGRDEDLQGEPFVGRSGKLLDRLLLEELGIDRSRVYIANVVKCRPPDNRDPLAEEIAACRPYLERPARAHRPRRWWSPSGTSPPGCCSRPTSASPSCGARRTRSADGQLVPTYHPAAALRSGGVVVAEMRADLVRAKQLLGWSG